jgi:hypothetical protein
MEILKRIESFAVVNTTESVLLRIEKIQKFLQIKTVKSKSINDIFWYYTSSPSQTEGLYMIKK